MKGQESSQSKFLWSVAIIQLVIVGVYWLLFKYDDHAHPFKHHGEVFIPITKFHKINLCYNENVNFFKEKVEEF